MKTLRICIGSNDGTSIAFTHMGDTNRFVIFDVLENGTANLIEERSNTAVSAPHAGPEKMKAVVQILADVDVFVAEKNSPNFRNIAAQTRHQPVVVLKAQTIEETLTAVGQAFARICEMVLERKSGKRGEVLQLSMARTPVEGD